MGRSFETTSRRRVVAKEGTTLKKDLSEDTCVGGVLLVAAWFVVNAPFPKILSWLEPFDYERVRIITSAHPIVALVSDNDMHTHGDFMEQNKKLFQERVGAQIVVQANGGHFKEVHELVVIEQANKMLQ